MASLPPRPASQSRSSPRDETVDTVAQQQRDEDSGSSPSASRSDPQTVVLDGLGTQGSDKVTPPTAVMASSGPTEPTEPTAEPRKCWICFTDENEEGAPASEWRTPCPCALTAHESCLLDWVADMESPTSNRSTGTHKGPILCPQCKEEIRLARPRSVVVEAVRAVERLGSLLVIPGVLFVGVGTLYQAAVVHGATSVYFVFGVRDGYRILAPLYTAPGQIAHENAVPHLVELVRDSFRHWRLYGGLALIPPVLVLSRTSIADSVLPILPVLFFATSSNQELDTGQALRNWPPSASLSFALLPYIRGLYNTYYERVWGAHERRWLREIQPRSGNSDREGDRRNGDLRLQDDAEGVLEINVDLNIINEGWDREDEQDDEEEQRREEDQDAQQPQGAAEEPQRDRGPAHPLHAPPIDLPEAVHGDHAAAQPGPPQHPRPQAEPRNDDGRQANFLVPAARAADSLLGALAFPAIAAAAGELLRMALPKSWTTSQANGRPAGLLQMRWGRSIVGGCAVVVLKDAIMLYVRWKIAQSHRRRRVLNYDKKKKTWVDP
ncbi:hypothetical protein BDY21DRAFT_356188 [Lineolata rhizophorae]|uniref:RING-CH-type domain-containing protein n=1 Tax=Lineolata rhizophorae TaxID=578093 RepID=A0A6A6NNK3_9PEZI|nr:hypothetical protein BDY21DRAFT_356188 [Lineolata rhizophorae]